MFDQLFLKVSRKPLIETMVFLALENVDVEHMCDRTPPQSYGVHCFAINVLALRSSGRSEAVVGAAGFEPATVCLRGNCSTS